MEDFILASASPRRRELLHQIGLPCRVIISNIKEEITSDDPAEIVKQLAYQKAYSVANTTLKRMKQEAAVVIGADTVVYDGKRILGKPDHKEEACEMLTALQGKSHQVFTGVSLFLLKGDGIQRESTFYEETKVTFYPMSAEEIARYVETKDPLDKAGAYGIQGFCARYIAGIEGDYNNVVGLPVGRLYQELKALLEQEGFSL